MASKSDANNPSGVHIDASFTMSFINQENAAEILKQALDTKSEQENQDMNQKPDAELLRSLDSKVLDREA